MKRNQIEFRRFNHTLGEMEYSSEMAGGLEQFFSNDCCDELSEEYQFTGMRDCKQVKIFEGDIVLDHNGIGEVQYSDKKAALKVNYHDGFSKWFIDYNLKGERESIEVIGNIHQNKELLGANK